MSKASRITLSLALVGLVAAPVAAQSNSATSMGSFAPSAFAKSLDSLPFQAAAPAHKDATIAGVLSFVIPGVGSYYAGNNKHGTIHLGIHVLSYAVIVGSAVNCVNSAATSDCSDEAGGVIVGWLGMVTNGVWSIFTAVHDARATNAKGAQPGRVVGSLFIEPSVVRLGAESGNAQMGLQLLSIHK